MLKLIKNGKKKYSYEEFKESEILLTFVQKNKILILMKKTDKLMAVKFNIKKLYSIANDN